MKLLVISLSLVAAFAPPKKTTWRDLDSTGYLFSFDQYCREYGKQYVGAEKERRSRIYYAALEQIKEHNTGNSTYKMGLSQHTDKDETEWKSLKGLHRGLLFSQTRVGAPERSRSLESLPASLDWREKGVVTKVKDQGGCGSCWAFSATETLESALAIAGGPLLELSPQELVSCAPNPKSCGGSGGCDGSTQPLAFNYTARAGEVLASSYPYEGSTGTCDPTKIKSPAMGIKGYVTLPTNDYAELMAAVVEQGPIAISVDASWGMYEEGVFTCADYETSLCGTTIDHAVQLVGYGTEGGLDYWLVRNSWGESWGEGGYIKVARYGATSKGEPCGTDSNPGEGYGCKGGPATLPVCGISGILSASSYPTGAFAH